MVARKKARARARKRGVTWATVRKLALSFPGMTEGTSYGEHAFLLDGKFFSRLNVKEEGLVVYAAEPLRDALLAGRADVYFTTDHYRNYPYVLAKLERLPRAELASLFEEAFRAKAKRRRVAEYEAQYRKPRALTPWHDAKTIRRPSQSRRAPPTRESGPGRSFR